MILPLGLKNLTQQPNLPKSWFKK